MYLDVAVRQLPFSSKEDLKKKFFEEHSFWEGGVWYGVNGKITQLFRSINSAICEFFYSSISSIHPVAKSVVRQGIESIRSPKQRNDLCLCFCINPSSMETRHFYSILHILVRQHEMVSEKGIQTIWVRIFTGCKEFDLEIYKENISLCFPPPSYIVLTLSSSPI